MSTSINCKRKKIMEINNANIYIFDHYIIIMVRKISFEIKKRVYGAIIIKWNLMHIPSNYWNNLLSYLLE